MRSVHAGTLPVRGSPGAIPTARKAVTKTATVDIAHCTRKTSTDRSDVKNQISETKPQMTPIKQDLPKVLSVPRDIGENIPPLVKLERASNELATTAVPITPSHAKRMNEHLGLLKEIVASLGKLTVNAKSTAETKTATPSKVKVDGPALLAGERQPVQKANIPQSKAVPGQAGSAPACDSLSPKRSQDNSVPIQRLRMELPISGANNPQPHTVVKGNTSPSLTFIQDTPRSVKIKLKSKADHALDTADWLKTRIDRYPGQYTFSIRGVDVPSRGANPAIHEIWLRYAPSRPDHLFPNMLTKDGDGFAWKIKCRIYSNSDGQGTIHFGTRAFRFKKVEGGHGKGFAQQYRVNVYSGREV